MKFAVQMENDPRVMAWVKLICKKLRGHDLARIPFGNDLRILKDGLVVFDIEPIFPKMLGWFVLIPSFIAAALGHVIGWNLGWLLMIGGVIFTAWELFWTPLPYMLMILIQTRRITGRWKLPRRADQELLGRVVSGKV